MEAAAKADTLVKEQAARHAECLIEAVMGGHIDGPLHRPEDIAGCFLTIICPLETVDGSAEEAKDSSAGNGNGPATDGVATAPATEGSAERKHGVTHSTSQTRIAHMVQLPSREDALSRHSEATSLSERPSLQEFTTRQAKKWLSEGTTVILKTRFLTHRYKLWLNSAEGAMEWQRIVKGGGGGGQQKLRSMPLDATAKVSQERGALVVTVETVAQSQVFRFPTAGTAVQFRVYLSRIIEERDYYEDPSGGIDTHEL